MPDFPTDFPDIGRSLVDSDKILVNTSKANVSAVGSYVFARRGLGDIFSVKDYGATGDGVTDDLAAFNTAIAAMASAVSSVGATLYVPSGTYRLSAPLRVARSCSIVGPHGVSSYSAAALVFDAGQHGIIVDGPFTSPDGGNGSYSVIRDIEVRAAAKTTTAHGVTLRANAILERVFVRLFKGNGFHIVASSSIASPYASEFEVAWVGSTAYKVGTFVKNGGNLYICNVAGTSAASGGPTGTGTAITDGTVTWKYVSSTNANLWAMYSCRSQENDGHGLYVDGIDTNAGTCHGLDVSNNGGWGVLDQSFLGNTYVGCHATGNTTGPYGSSVGNGNQSSVNQFLNCYSEGGGPSSNVTAPGMIVGGLHGAGVSGPRIGATSEGLSATPITINVVSDGTDPDSQLVVGGQYAEGSFLKFVTVNSGSFSLKFTDAAYPRTNAFSLNYANAVGYHGWGWTSYNSTFDSLREIAPGTLWVDGDRGYFNGMTRIICRSAPPGGSAEGPWGNGRWCDFFVGDRCENSAPSVGNPIGWICTAAGTAGQYVEGKTATANGTTSVTLSAASAYLKAGNYLTINATTARVVSISGTTMVMSTTIPAGSGLAIAYHAPTWTSYGTL